MKYRCIVWLSAVIGCHALPTVRIPVADDPHRSSNFTTLFGAADGRDLYLLQSTATATLLLPVPTTRLLRSSNLEPTSAQARRNGCAWAVNGGPYQPDGTPVGTVVKDGHWIQAGSPSDIGIGQTRDQKEWIFGTVDDKDETVEWFVTGFDWLVYNGENVARNNTTGAERAPRTAVGITSDGELLLVVGDGCETCLWHRGLTLDELADWMIEFQARYAINLDGGGSSVLVQNGTYVSHPTCWDVPLECERAIATVLCIK